MAWTNITNAQLAVGAPLRSVDILALRDNFAGMANGDVDAPRITDPAISDVIAGTNYIPVVGGGGTTSLSSVKLCEFRVMRGGSLTIRFRVSSANNTGYYRIYKNGVALTGESSVGAGTSTITLTGLSFATNDLLQFYGRATDSPFPGEGSMGVDTVRIGVANNTVLFPLSDEIV